jgi:hypothetical protein
VASGEGFALGETIGEVSGFSERSGDGIAGLSETIGTLGLAVGVVVPVLQPPRTARTNKASAIKTVAFFILYLQNEFNAIIAVLCAFYLVF